MTRSTPWLWLAAVLVTALFATAGGWQWGKGETKGALLDSQARVLEQREAQPLSAAATQAQRLDWARGSGRFSDAPAVWLDNQLRDGRPGVRVYRVFQPAAPAAPLLVEMGWLPLPPDRSLPGLEPLPQGELEIEGLLLPPPSPGMRIGQALQGQADGSVLALRMELDAIAAELGLAGPLAGRILRLDPDIALGYERDLDILPNTLPPEKHRGYAVQWWGLAAATVVITLILSLRRIRR